MTESTRPKLLNIASPTLRGKIALVVEDVAPLRRLVVRVLTLAGLIVREAADGMDGLAAFQTGPADIVVTDLRMPRMGGVELARAVLATNADMRIVFITGYADATAAREIEEEFPTCFVLRKPFAANDLRQALERVSAAAEPPKAV